MELYLSANVLEALRAHAARAFPDECVGLLFGRGDRVTRAHPLPNASPTPRTHFFADPTALLRALQGADARGETHLGSYHSHPEGDAWPSETDLRALDGVVLIIGREAVRAFRLAGGKVAELELHVLRTS